MKKIVISIFSVLLATSSFAGGTYQPSRDERNAVEKITQDEIRAHIRFLSSDLLEGRGPATPGDRLAQQYIASQFESMGFKPAAGNGSWYQEFDMIGIDTKMPKVLTFVNGAKKLEAKFHTDYMGALGVQKPLAVIRKAEMVFVGYGIVAPEYGWDDFKDVNVKGKILLIMNNDPAGDPNLFAGKTRLYYGRWRYKYEEAARKGAIGALIIHTNESAGYPFQVIQSSWAGEQFQLPSEGESVIPMQSWITDSMAKKLVKLSGYDLDDLRARAEKKDFRPVPLKTTVSAVMKAKIRRAKTANVLGLLQGSDPKLSSEVVVYTAHHDHFGRKADAKPGEDAIFNGALDNASGVGGMLTLATAFTALKTRPRRSILFAAVGAEEQGLLGSAYFARHPVVPPGKIAANINMDGLSIWGRASDLTLIGKGKSNLDDTVEAILRMQGRTLKPDQFPEKGYFYRSDQFSLAKIGVPAVFFDTGVDIIGRPAGWGKAQIEKFENEDYHQPSDELRPTWDFSGAVEDLSLNFYLGFSVAQADEMPKWNKGDEFELTRLKALADLKN